MDRSIAATAAPTLAACLAGPSMALAQTILRMAHIYAPDHIWYETTEA